MGDRFAWGRILSAIGLRTSLGWISLCCLLSQSAWAGPLDLQDPTPRWIEVRFEVSPASEPGRLNRRWSSIRVAHFEPSSVRSSVQIRIPSAEIEAHLATTGIQIVAGSFSDFVWILDSGSGHVVQAEMTGRVRERFWIGPIPTSATVEIQVEMTTHAAAGFRPSGGVFGLRTHAFCSPPEHPPACVLVAPIRFDPISGYVNAVGSLVASVAIAKIRAFSPLGEVLFSERRPETTETAGSEPSRPDALCSAGFDGPCWADLGGES